VGTLRYAQHRSVPDIHQHLLHRGVAIAPRTGVRLSKGGNSGSDITTR
jgi:hypothetical protein